MEDYFFLAFNSLKRRKLRSWLTILGIFIGIAAVVSLISLGQGLQGYINEQFEALGKDKIIIQTRGTMGPPGSATSAFSKLTEDDLDAIKEVNGVEKVAGLLMKTARIEFGDEIAFQFASGIPQDEQKELLEEMQGIKIEEGRGLKEGDEDKAVVGSYYPKGKVFSEKVGLRDKINIEGREFKIIGVLKPIGNPYDDSSIILTQKAMKELYNSGDELSMIVAKADKGADVRNVAYAIEDELRDNRNEQKGKETFQIQTAEQLLETFSNVFAVIQAVLVGIAAISLLVGGIGIMNTMYTAILERTKEIGTMKAVGAKNPDILFIFLIESGLLGLVGGAIGIAFGAVIAKAVEHIGAVNLGTGFLQASFSLELIAGALLFSFAIGTASGILPAIQASKLKPADALRYE